jgi:hypothetical protein
MVVDAAVHMMIINTQQLLRQVFLRLQLVAVARRFQRAAWIAAGGFFVILLLSRLLAVIPNYFEPVTLLTVPAVALLAAVVWWRRPKATTTARAIDAQAQTKDLFLTVAMIEQSSGVYQPIVVQQAEEKAKTIRPHQVVPFRWHKGAGQLAGAMAVLWLAVLFLPQLDPFGKDKERQKAEERRTRLDETRKATALRAALLEKKEAVERSERVEKALQALEKTFKEAKPGERAANLQKLAEHQKELGALWRALNEDKLKSPSMEGAQGFGKIDPQKLAQWREDLKKGDLSNIQKELEQLKQQLQQLAKMPDSAEKRKLEEQTRQQLASLADTLGKELNSPALRDALARALEQLDASKLKDLAKQATDGACESLGLSQKELEALAQALKNLQSVEEALKALAHAKKLADLQQLDCQKSGQCKGMSDYAALYAQLCGLGAGSGTGQGMGGPGQGEGGKAPEDDTLATAYKPEKSPTTLQAGKLLMQWKTRGVSDPGKADENFATSLRAVRQGVSEAIVQEQVPPGYHDSIKKYFDTLNTKEP